MLAAGLTHSITSPFRSPFAIAQNLTIGYSDDFSCSLKRREKHFIHLQIFFFYYANLASRHNSQNADLCQLRLFTWGF